MTEIMSLICIENYDITVPLYANYWCICNQADLSRIVTDECAQKCIYMYKRIHTYTHSLRIIYSYIDTRMIRLHITLGVHIECSLLPII